MIKLTTGQASAFNSPVIGKLFSDQTRQFPIKDAFQLSDVVQQIQSRLGAYNEQLRGIIEKQGGTIHPDGKIVYEDPEGAQKAQAQINLLNEAEIELPGEKLTIDDDWPKLTLAEATILGAIINDGKPDK